MVSFYVSLTFFYNIHSLIFLNQLKEFNIFLVPKYLIPQFQMKLIVQIKLLVIVVCEQGEWRGGVPPTLTFSPYTPTPPLSQVSFPLYSIAPILSHSNPTLRLPTLSDRSPTPTPTLSQVALPLPLPNSLRQLSHSHSSTLTVRSPTHTSQLPTPTKKSYFKKLFIRLCRI